MSATKPLVGGDLEYRVNEFKGYNSRDDQEFTDEGTIIAGRNMAYEYPVGVNARTFLTTRLGYTRRNVTGLPNRIQGGKIYKRFADKFFRCMVVCEGTLYEAQFVSPNDPLVFTAIPASAVSPTFGFFFAGTMFDAGAKRVRMVQFTDKLWIVDGTNRLRFYDGTYVGEVTVNALDDARPSIIVLHKNRLWVNSTKVGQRNQMWWSALNDGTGWAYPPTDDAGTQLFRGFPDESSPIDGVGAFANGLTIHQAGRIFLFNTVGAPYPTGMTVTQWEIIELKVERGCNNHDSIADLGGKILYMTTRGINSMSGVQALQGNAFTYDSINATPISYNIEPDIFRTKLNTGAAVYFKYHYIFTMTSNSGVYNDIAFVYDVRRDKWCPPWENFNFSCFDATNINGEEYCYAFSDKDGFVYTLFDNIKDHDQPIKSWFRTHAIDFQMPKVTKTFRQAWFWAVTTSAGCYARWSIDYGPWREISFPFRSEDKDAKPLGQFILGFSKLGFGYLANLVRTFALRASRGRHIRLEWSNDNAEGTAPKDPFGINAIELMAYTENYDQRRNM